MINRYKWATIKTRKLVYNPPYKSKILDSLPKPDKKS
jgi:ubiquinol-cytochrome c reductase cytochrome c1 subunit